MRWEMRDERWEETGRCCRYNLLYQKTAKFDDVTPLYSKLYVADDAYNGLTQQTTYPAEGGGGTPI